MGISETFFDLAFSSPSKSFLFIPAILILATCIQRLLLHPLSSIPGPILSRFTSLWLYFHAYNGDEASVIHKAHKKFGPFIRVAPNEVNINDVDAIDPIYIMKGGFLKAPCYANFDIDGHKTIFSTTDPDYRSLRAKGVNPMFSTKSIRENEVALYACVDRMVNRLKVEAATGQPVDVLNLGRSLAVDVVSTHLFWKNYDGIAENRGQLSASAFVDTFVAVGRFFYLPNFVFLWVEWVVDILFSDEYTTKSMKVVEKFADDLVSSSSEKEQNYPGRLAALGLEQSEIKAQCKDLIFAGTDSTGMNFATICRHLALNPEKYERLRTELLSNKCDDIKQQEIQALPYLSAVIKEGLRISMANPTRLPRMVPPGGWTFKGIFFPAGTIVGCGAYGLHFNDQVFPAPHDFVPERWLDESLAKEGNKHMFAFGAGSRVCIARNLATIELYMAIERLVEADALRGAKALGEVSIYEWFNSSVKQKKIELVYAK